MSSLPNPMLDAALPTGEIPRVPALVDQCGAPGCVATVWSTDQRPYEFTRDSEPDAYERGLADGNLHAPVGLQAMTLPNGRWLLVLDNVSEVDALGLDRDRLSERSGAADVLTFVGSVQVTEAYPEQVLERDEQLIDRLRDAGVS